MSPILISWIIAVAVIAFLVAAAVRNRRNGYVKPRSLVSPIVEVAVWLQSLAEDPPQTPAPEPPSDPARDLAALNHAVTIHPAEPVREEHAVH